MTIRGARGCGISLSCSRVPSMKVKTSRPKLKEQLYDKNFDTRNAVPDDRCDCKLLTGNSLDKSGNFNWKGVQVGLRSSCNTGLSSSFSTVRHNGRLNPFFMNPPSATFHTSASFKWSISNRVKDMVYSLSSKDFLDDRPKIKLPAHLSKALDKLPSDISRFEYLVTNKAVVPKVLEHFYRPLKGSLSPECTTSYSLLLFSYGWYFESLVVLLDNLSFANITPLLADQIIPQLELLEGRDIVIFSFIKSCLLLDQPLLASQLLQELEYDSTTAQEYLNEARIQLDMYQATSLSELALFCYNPGLSSYSIDPSVTLEQFCSNPHLLITSRLCLLNNILRIGELQLYQKIFHYSIELISSPFSLKFLIQNAVDLHKKMGLSDTASRDRQQFMDDYVEIICQELQSTNISFEPSDIDMIALLAYSKQALTRVLRAYQQYCKKNKKEFDISTLSRLLKRSVDLRESTTCCKIIRLGKGNFSAHQIAASLTMLCWARRNNGPIDDSGVYYGGNDLDTSLLQQVIDITPKDIITQALPFAMRNLNNHILHGNWAKSKTRTSSYPGRILWHLVMSVERSRLEFFPPFMELYASEAISHRPILEQLRLIALPKISSQGIMNAMQAHCLALNSSLKMPDNERELSVKFLTAGIALIDQKDGGMSTAHYLGKLMSLLCRSEHSDHVTIAVEMIKMLGEARSIQAPESSIVQSISYLISRGDFQTAIYVVDSLSWVPAKAYFHFLTTASRKCPLICAKVLKWLQNDRKLDIPNYVFRQMAVGYAQSPLLTDSQSAIRVVTMIRQLRGRGQPPGKKLVQALVDSLLDRAERRNWGSRERLQWALKLARQEGVDSVKEDEWRLRLYNMRTMRKGYWGPKYFHLPQFPG